MTISNTKINLYSENIIKFILGQKEKIIPLGRIQKIDYVIGVLFLTETNRYFKQNKINSHAYYLAYTFINLFNKIRLRITKSQKFDINDINHFIVSLSANIDYFNSRMESTNNIKLKINTNLAKFQMEIFPILHTLMVFNKSHENNINLANSENNDCNIILKDKNNKIFENSNINVNLNEIKSNLTDSTCESDLHNYNIYFTNHCNKSCNKNCYDCVVSNVLAKFFYILLQTAKFVGTGIINEPNLVRLSEYYANILYTWLKSNDILFLSSYDDDSNNHTELYDNYLNYKNKLNYSLIELELGSETIDEIINWIDSEITENLSIKIK